MNSRRQGSAQQLPDATKSPAGYAINVPRTAMRVGGYIRRALSSLGTGRAAGRRHTAAATTPKVAPSPVTRHPAAGCPTCDLCGGEGIIGGFVMWELGGDEWCVDERCAKCGGSGLLGEGALSSPTPAPARTPPVVGAGDHRQSRRGHRADKGRALQPSASADDTPTPVRPGGKEAT